MKKINKDNYFELAQFLMDYHSGQWSRGYRILCKLDPRGTWNASLSAELRNTPCYEYLVSRYAGKV